MSVVDSQDESILDFLKKINSMVDSIVVIDENSLTTTTLTMTIRKKLVKLFLQNPHRRTLKKIIHLEAFTSFILQQMLEMTQNEVYATLRPLIGLGIIEKSKTMRGRGGPPVVIYLVRGGDESRVFEAQKLHADLMPKGYVPALEYYVDEALLDSIIMKVEKASLGMSVRKTVVTQFVKEALGTPLNYTMVLDTLSHFRERGWKVVQ